MDANAPFLAIARQTFARALPIQARAVLSSTLAACFISKAGAEANSGACVAAASS